MHPLAQALFLAQFAATFFMTGLIWFVQIVHYPLFGSVHRHSPAAGFLEYHTRHANRTTWVVFPPMAIELAASLAALSGSLRPGFVSEPAAIASAVLVVLIWASTGLLQVPLHDRLGREADEPTIAGLVASNWLRVVLWSARCVLLVAAIWQPLTAGQPVV